MICKKYLFSLIALLGLLSTSSQAKIVLPGILGDNMVLQQGEKVAIWGWASPKENVHVDFSGQSKSAIADDSGHWQVVLDPLKTSDQNASMTIQGSNTIVLSNVLVGEVWLCSGQSNMEYSMRKNSKVTLPSGGANWPVNELDSAHDKGLRIFLVDKRTLTKPDSTNKNWAVAEGTALRSFSAVGYFFGKELRRQLNVPIGIISSAVPGSRIEPWIPIESFEQSPYFKTANIPGEPGKFYAPMIAPLQRFAVRGFLWYQGESNCFLGERLSYAHKMEVLIDTWRKAWGNKKLPFYYVQIAPFEYSKSSGKVILTRESLPEFHEVQALVLNTPNTGLVVTTDLNDSLNNLHPHFKWEIGRRLALLALNKTYNKDIVSSGPVYDAIRISGDRAIVKFKDVGVGLISKDGNDLNWFEIAGADGKYVLANAKIDGKNEVIIQSDKVKKPMSVRFGWDEAAHPNLYNKEGLPARQFRTAGALTL